MFGKHNRLYWLSTALLLTSTNAQDTTVTSFVDASQTSTASPVNTFTVDVGRGQHKFVPDVIQAGVGDIVEFNFFPPNHSVVRADYLLPCVPYEMTGPRVGFFSGFFAVDAILSDPPTWSVQINDTDPIFYYCSAPGSCIDWAMVGVINPNASTSLETQRELARNSSFMLQPGESWPAEASSSEAGYAPTSTYSSPANTATAPPAATSSEAAAASSSSSNPLSTGAIAGIAIGGAAVLLIAGFLIWYCGRKSRQTPINQPMEGGGPPPGYASGYTNGYNGPMSPTGKYLSGVTVSTAQPSPGYQGHYPYGEQNGHMAPFGAVQAQSPHQHPQAYFTPQQQTSPRSAAFGGSPMQMQTSENAMINQGIVPAVEADSERGNRSPSPQGGAQASGIEAFLARQGRMSPSQSGTGSESGVGGGAGSAAEGFGPAIRGPFTGPTGPYEMSASGTNSWQQHHHR